MASGPAKASKIKIGEISVSPTLDAYTPIAVNCKDDIAAAEALLEMSRSTWTATVLVPKGNPVYIPVASGETSTNVGRKLKEKLSMPRARSPLGDGGDEVAGSGRQGKEQKTLKLNERPKRSCERKELDKGLLMRETEGNESEVAIRGKKSTRKRKASGRQTTRSKKRKTGGRRGR